MAERGRADRRPRGRAAPGWPSASGSRTCRRRSSAPATSGRSSTTTTSAPPSIPEENLWGTYTTEDQGQLLTVFGTEQGLRYRIPFGDGRGRDRLPARPRDRGRRPGRDDGRRRREVRRLADDLRALLGRAAAGSSASSRRSRRTRDWLTTVTPVRVAGAGAADRPRLRPDLVVRGDGRVGAAAPTRRSVFTPAPPRRASRRQRPEARWLRGGFWRNFQASTARSTTSTSRCCGRRRKVAAMPTGPAQTRRVDHLHRGQSNDCYWHGLFGGIYIVAHAAGHVRAPDRGRGRGRPTRSGTQRRARSCVDLDLDGLPEVLAQPTRARSWPSSRARAAGSGRGTSAPRGTRWPRCSGAGRRRTTRRCAPTRPRGDDPARGRGAGHADVDDRGRRRRAGIDPRPRDGQGGGPLGAAVLRRPRAPLGAGAVPRAGRDARGVSRRPRTTELGDFRDGDFARRPPRPAARSRCRANGTALGQPLTVEQDDPPRRRPAATRSSSSSSRSTTAGDAPIDDAAWASSCRSTCWAAAATRRPGTTSRGERTAPRRQRARPRASTRSATATTGWASRSRPRPSRRRTRGGARSRPCRTRSPGFERVYQGSSLLLSWPVAARPRRVPPVLRPPGGQRRARPRGRRRRGAPA